MAGKQLVMKTILLSSVQYFFSYQTTIHTEYSAYRPGSLWYFIFLVVMLTLRTLRLYHLYASSNLVRGCMMLTRYLRSYDSDFISAVPTRPVLFARR